jgi:hypothetical protein
MGVLDDAIRDHLDLKRRHGADPEEIERAEREALGPVRRDPGAPGQIEATEDGAEAFDPEDELDWEFEGGSEERSVAMMSDRERVSDQPAPGVSAEQPVLDQPPATEADQDPVFDQDLLHEEQPTTVAPSATPVEPTQPREPESKPDAGDATVEYSLDDALAGHEEKGRESPVEEEPRGAETEKRATEHDEDVLEETPDFLQDTPDHDRLWFEQRPPRDFDLGE